MTDEMATDTDKQTELPLEDNPETEAPEVAKTPEERALAAAEEIFRLNPDLPRGDAVEAEQGTEETAEASEPEAEATSEAHGAEGAKGSEADDSETTGEGESEAEGESSDDTNPRISEALAKISRAEAQSRKRIEQAEKQLERNQREVEPLLELKDRLTASRDNPIEVLQQLGTHLGIDLSYENLTDAVLNGKLPDTATPAQPQVPKEYVERMERLEQQLQQQAETDLNNKVAAYHSKVSSIISSHSDDYELIAAEAESAGIEPRELVGQFVAEVYQATSQEGEGKLLEPEEACKQLEDYLQTRAERFLRAKKLQARINPPSPTPEVQEEAPATKSTTKPQSTSKTLTSKHTGNVSPAEKDLSDEARQRRAELAIEKLMG